MRIIGTFAVVILVSILMAAPGQAQAPKVKFYPYGDLVVCKGCGHLKEDYWRLKFRLENVSGEDLIVYGRKVTDDSEFDFIHQVQYRNPHLCEWQYGYGSSEKSVSWKDMSSSEKVPTIVKAGGHIDSERGISAYEYQAVTRFTAYVGRLPGDEPNEVYSEPYVGVRNGDPAVNAPSFRIVDEACTAQCTIGIDQSPEINGIRLGMSLTEFRKHFPKAKIHRLHRNLVNYRTVSIWQWDLDAYSVHVDLLDDKVARIEASIRSLDGKRSDPQFYALVAEKIKLPFWPPYQSGWECKEFVVDVLTNEQPTISVQTKAFMKVNAMLVEQDYKKRK